LSHVFNFISRQDAPRQGKKKIAARKHKRHKKDLQFLCLLCFLAAIPCVSRVAVVNLRALSHEKNDSHNDNDCHNADQIKRKIGIAAFGNVCSASQATCTTGVSVLHKQQKHKARQTTR
jgi:hypothetical protein